MNEAMEIMTVDPKNNQQKVKARTQRVRQICDSYVITQHNISSTTQHTIEISLLPALSVSVPT